MPDFTVIDGDGDRGRADREASQQNLEMLIVFLLRDLTSGDYPYRTVQQFIMFLEHARERGVPMGPVFEGAIKDLNERAFRIEEIGWEPENELKNILCAALRVTAESMSTDGAARGRRSQRGQRLDRAIKEMILSSETRSRENGWSYVADLIEPRLGKWRPQREPAKGPPRPGKRNQAKKPLL